MNTFVRVSSMVVKKLWYTMAILLVTFAVLLSLLRYILPHLEDKKHLLEEYVQSQYGVAFEIAQLHADWTATGPRLILHDVSLDTEDKSLPIALSISQVYVELDFWDSLTRATISSKQFNLVGLQLDVDVSEQRNRDNGDTPVVDALKNLFLNQLQSFSIIDSHLTLVTRSSVDTYHLDKLKWVNQGAHHQGSGNIRDREFSSNSASFVLDLEETDQGLDGVLYAQGVDLDVSPWLNRMVKTRAPLLESKANLEAWIAFTDQTLESVQIELDDSHFSWDVQGDEPLSTSIHSGEIQALPNEQQAWSFRVDDLVIEANSQAIAIDLIGWKNDEDGLLVNTIKPMSITPLVGFLPLFTEAFSVDDIGQLKPSGELATLQFKMNKGQPQIAGKLIDLGWAQLGKMPGFADLELDFYWFNNQGSVQLHADTTQLAASNAFGHDLSVNNFDMNLKVYQPNTEFGWLVSVPDVYLHSDSLRLSGASRYSVTSGELQISASIDELAVNQVSHYFPSAFMGKNTTAYLKRAMTGEGKVVGADVIWSGNPKAYPFAHNEGVFHAQVELQDADFAFSRDWPALKNMALTLDFINADLFMSGPSATLADIDVSDLRSEILTLNNSQSVEVWAKGSGQGAQVAALMRQSNLQSLASLLTKDVIVDGKVESTLALSIPLKGNKQVAASGIATLTDSRVQVPSIITEFDLVNGQIGFENDTITIEGLSANLLDQPVEVHLSGHRADTEYLLDIDVAGDWQVAPLIERITPDLNEYLYGEGHWDANVTVALATDEFSYSAKIESALANTVSLLPTPFAKSHLEHTMLVVTAEGNNQASTIAGTLGDEVRFDGILPHKEMQFSRAHLALGESEFVGLGMGFSISADVELLDVEHWFNTINVILSGPKADRPPIFGTPERIFIETDQLVVFGQVAQDVDVTVKQTNNNWELKLDSDQARGTVMLDSNWFEKGINIEADFVKLDKWDAEPQLPHAGWDHTSLPPLYFHCKQCEFDNYNLGEVTLDVAKNKNGLDIRRLEAHSPFGHLTASGHWVQEQEAGQTSITGSLASSDFGRLLQDFGLESGIKDSQADIKFDVHWPQSPMEFDFATIQGDLNWSLTDGYLSSLDDKGSRVLTLLSLNSLVRKLSLDFRDVFAKGFFYDGMSGSVYLADGKAATQDTQVDGAAGEIEIKGYADLVAQELNYDVNFAPNVTGNIPFVVYFAATPPAAIAALAIDQVLNSTKVISNVNYRVTGPWRDPSFEELGRDSTEIILPARQQSEMLDPQAMPLTEEDLEPLKMDLNDG